MATETIGSTSDVLVQSVEPISLADVKLHLNIPSSLTAHDTLLADIIESAYQQWERDTGWLLMQRTATVVLPRFVSPYVFDYRPVNSIASIAYYDSANASQTLSSATYSLDSDRGRLYLAYDQTWPDTAARWDAVTITAVVGEHSAQSTVPQAPLQAIRLLCGYYWLKNRGDFDGPYDLRAYESLVGRFTRARYP